MATATKEKPETEKVTLTVEVSRMEKPLILREHVGEIDHPDHGKVMMSSHVGTSAPIFEFRKDDVYYVFGVQELADALFDMIEKQRAGKP